MAFNKYIIDYKTVKEEDEKGRIRTRVEYIGPRYTYRKDPEETVKKGRITLGLVALQWVLVLGALCIRSDFMFLTCTILPLTMAVFPLYFETRALLIVARDLEYITREQADRIGSYYPIGSTVQLILVIASLAGTLISLLRGQAGLAGGGILYLLVQLGAVICAYLCFRNRSAFDTREDFQDYLD